MTVQLEQNVLIDRLTGNTEKFSKAVAKHFSSTQRITVSN